MNSRWIARHESWIGQAADELDRRTKIETIQTQRSHTAHPANHKSLPALGVRESPIQAHDIRRFLAWLRSHPPCILSKSPCFFPNCSEKRRVGTFPKGVPEFVATEQGIFLQPTGNILTPNRVEPLARIARQAVISLPSRAIWAD